MKQQHHPQDIKSYQKGINSDSNKEILGNSEEGEHVDALNMRSISMDGDNFAKKKIKGEESLFPLIDNRCNAPDPSTLTFAGYECMMAQEVNGHIIEIWASSIVGEFPFMRIDGQIVLYSEDFPIDIFHPLQYDKNESCVGGEIYVTNNNTPPMVFSIKDLMENSAMIDGFECTERYFSLFDVTAYTINPSAILHKPAFIKQDVTSAGYDFVAGTSGLCVGSYSYSYRMVDAQGERTAFSPITELIPVVRKNSSATLYSYPHQQTFSSNPDTSSTTIYGNHIRFRYENYVGFVSMEVRRDSWYAGDPIDNPPVSEIIATIPVNDGMDILNFFDRAEANFVGAITLTLEEQSTNMSTVRRAKSIRYFNQKLYLMNISYQSKDISGTVTFVDENDAGFETIENLGQPGHKHVYNAAMYKSNMRGERTGFGVVLFDKNNNATYATEVPNFTNFTFPDRRAELVEGSDPYELSYKGVVRAANEDGEVSWTHEVFDLTNAVSKTGQDEERPGDPLRYNYRDSGGDGYHAMNPTSQNDSQSDLNKAVNNRVAVDSESAIADWQDYSPPAFGPNYYAQGFALKGIDTYPDWADGFSVVQTDPAKRVVAQGLGFYSLIQADRGLGPDTQKETDAFWAYFPDLDLLNPEIAEDLVNNAGAGYKIQCVSPLGYFSEVYNSRKAELDQTRWGADIITYARVIRDKDSANSTEQINPILGGDSGILDDIVHDPSQDYRYPAYGRFTNSITPDGPEFPSNGNGNYEFTILDVNDITTNSGRQTYFRIQLTESVYNELGTTSASNVFMNADEAGVMEWREPMYVINLVKDVNINPGLTTEYKYTGNYIKFKSLVLESNGSNGQTATLVSERWEDCIPQITGQVNGVSTYGALKRFVYVTGIDEVERRWMNVTFESGATISTILTALDTFGVYNDAVITDGFDIYGIYTSTQSSEDIDGISQSYALVFNETPLYTAFTVPAPGSNVYVKYDNRIPVRVFGGDTYVNESIWAVLDNEYNKSGDPKDDTNDFRMNAPFPLKSYDYVDTYPIWEDSDPWNYEYGFGFQFCNASKLEIARIRQLITMWTAETRINLSFAFNNESPDKANSDQFFPLLNYIPRPYRWNDNNPTDRTTFENDNHLIAEYYDDYGFEWNLWVFGGFRFTPQVNLDYSKSQTTELFTSVPIVGFVEETDFCTRIIWSLKRPANAQNTPSVKTFLPSAYFDISDDTGEIKFAFSALSSDKGNNLYALTDSGVCLLLVDKRIVSEINANELATVGSDAGGILNQLWIDKTIGMHDETWRSWAEYSNVLFFCNGIAAYTFGDNQLTDITKTGFFELLNRRFNSLIGPGYEAKLSGGFNVLTKEYVMNVSNIDPDTRERVFNTLIFGTQQASLQCQSTYNYDKYLYYKNHFFGMKNEGEFNGTFELGLGNQINGEKMPCYLTGLSDAIIIADKEFIRIRVNSNSKPEQIYFYKSFNDYKSDTYDSVVDAVAIPLSIKNYFGYECYIPRSVVAPHYRNQGRVLIFKIVSSADEEFLVTSTGVQYKALK
jgi:hypothetical protein